MRVIYDNRRCKREIRDDVQVLILSGPPGAGKSTYVNDHISPGDVVLDFDALYSAVSFLPMHTRDDRVSDLVLQLREKFYQVVSESNSFNRAWIITAEPKAEDRLELCERLNGKSYVLLEHPDLCMKRTESRDSDSYWNVQIDMWFNEYTIDQEKETIITRAVKITEL